MTTGVRSLSGLRLPLLLGMVVLSLAGLPAMGQRPALVKNTDEPGRTPYEAEVEFYNGGCSGSTCSNFLAFGSTVLLDVDAPVPAGKRLVIRHVSGVLYSSQGCFDCQVGLQSRRVISAQSLKWSFLGPFYSASEGVGLVQNGFSSDMFVTFGPGELPHLRLTTSLTNTISYVVISGYLIDSE